MWNAWVLRVFLLSHASSFLMETEDNSIQYRGSSTIPSSFKLELLSQCEMTSFYYIVTKSSIVDNMWVQDPPLVCLLFCERKIKI